MTMWASLAGSGARRLAQMVCSGFSGVPAAQPPPQAEALLRSHSASTDDMIWIFGPDWTANLSDSMCMLKRT